MRKLIFIAMFFLLIISCNNNNDSREGMTSSSATMASYSTEMDMVMPQEPMLLGSNVGSKIQTNGNLSVEVKNLNDSISYIDDLIVKYEGVKISSNTSKSSKPYINMNILIPSISFDNFIKEIKTISSSIVSENIYTNDVTEQFIDISARLNVMKKTQDRFVSLLNETNNVQEVIQVETELMRIQSEIDSLEGRKDYLNKTTKNSELNLNISEESLLSGDGWSFNNSFENAIKNLVSFSKDVIDWLLHLLVFIPIIILVSILLYLPYKIYKKRRFRD